MAEGLSPLRSLIFGLKNTSEFKRLESLKALFEQFHLKFAVTSEVDGRRAIINGRSVFNFGSANYLGLDQHPEVIEASAAALREFGSHTGSSRIFVSHQNMIDLENEISDMVGSEKTLVGHNISQIHAGVIPALFSSSESVLFLDRHAHMSIYQACQIAVAKGARIERVDVEDLEDLKRKMKSYSGCRGALFVDGIYSMQGHQPNFSKLVGLCRSNGFLLYIDDAHGVGIRGERGGGVVEEHGLGFDNVLVTGSLQKAIGCYGGFISGSEEAIDYLRLTSKAYIFSGTLQPAAVGGALAAIRLIKSDRGRALRHQLQRESRRVREALRQMGFPVELGDSPIIPVLIGKDIATLMAGRKMFDLGIYLNSVLYPAVPKDHGVLRISLNSVHSGEEIEALLNAFQKLKDYLKNFRSPIHSAAHVAYQVAKSKWQGARYAGL